MKKVLSLCFLLSGISLFAQKDIPFEKEYFKENKSEFKDARDIYETGEKYYLAGNFEAALIQFDQAYKFNPNYSVLNYRMGVCLLYSSYKFKALDYFLKAHELNPAVSPDINYQIGFGYHLKAEWDNAIKYYEAHRKMLKSDDKAGQEATDKKIGECKTGKELQKKPERVWVDNLGKSVNSEYPEYAANISADEYVIIFTGRRKDTYGGEIDPSDGKYMEDVYIARRNEKGQWMPSENIGEDINTKSHNAPAGLSPDGKTLFLFYGDRGGGDVYQSDFVDGKYSKPKKLNSNISSKNYESSATISFDGKELYFASERPGGLGEEDIYVSRWDEKKNDWGAAENLGPVVNSKYRETAVFLHPDGETMYFSSERNGTMGGFDVFVSKRGEDGKWGEPVNVGWPINSPDDDVFFVVSGSGRYAYYSSYRSDGYGEKDIYRITFLGPAKQPLTSSEDNLLASLTQPVKAITIEPKVEVKSSNLAILKGVVRDAKSKQPLFASIEIIDNEKNELVTTITSDSKTGGYLVSLPAGKNYGIAVKAEGYLFHSENVDIPKASGYREYEKNIDLKKVEVGEVIVLRNIFFDYDKATLRDESRAELERLIKLMNDNPTLKIEISGHTDSQGDGNYNQKLSEARSKSVVEYLVKAGISPGRLEFKGYGESQLQVTDAQIYQMKTKSEKEEAHQQNRRTEFKILAR